MKTVPGHLQSSQTKVGSLLSRPSMVFWGMVCSAFIIRIGFILLLSPFLDAGQTLSVDALSYHQIAQNLVERQIFTSPVDPPYNPQLPSTFRPPLTPFYLTAIYLICGVNLTWGRVGLAIASAISCGLTYWLGKQLFNQTTGLVAGIISWVYPFFLLLVHLPLTEGLSILFSLLLLTLVYSSLADVQNTKRWKDVGIGVVFGLALLNKTTNIALFSCILVWALLLLSESRKQRFARLLVVVAIAGGMILPWTIRNYAIIGTLTPVNSNGGWTFYLGNNRYTEQNLAALEQGSTNGWIPPKEVFQPFADLSFADTNAWEKRSRELGTAFIREHPGKFLSFALRKLKIFWSPYQNLLDQITWYPLVLFSLIGLCCSFGVWKQHVILYVLILATTSVPIFFTSMPRFRAPIMPIIVIYSAVGLVNVYHWGKQKMPRTVINFKKITM